jgi:hypothetical protein
VWLALDRSLARGEALEEVLPQLEGVLRYTSELRERLTADGVDGITGAIGLYRCLKATLDAVPRAEIERMLAMITDLEHALGEMARSLAEIRRLKEAVGD